ncbi:hypothetical protein DOY81_011478 [Sarcophaga bullata]|nr:hypothetical protein DOY81_011478 [Sarcophaga bullata]
MDKTESVCVPSCVADFFNASPTCNNEVATTTTTTTVAPKTPNFNNLRQQCQTASETNKSVYFYIKYFDDIECKTYIYCEKIGENNFEALLMRCKNGYFDGTSKCLNTKPESCDIAATTPQP